MSESLLEVKELKTYFFTHEGVVRAVDDISFDIEAGETLGVIGESGSGKTVTGRSILRIVSEPGRIVHGRILFHGKDLLQAEDKEMQKIRGKKIGMVFQDPTSSLDPVYTIGKQLVEVIQKHQPMGKEEAVKRAIESLQLVGIPDPAGRINHYPHEFSIGQKQRIALARAISCQPELLIADEPTTALDVTIQAQVLNLLRQLKRDLRMSIMLITHDIGVIAEMADKVTVFYAGRMCECGDVKSIFTSPKHPYTEGLLESAPRAGLNIKEKLSTIPGTIPDLINIPSGCAFHPRCRYAVSECKTKMPELYQQEDGSCVACLRWAPNWNPDNSTI